MTESEAAVAYKELSATLEQVQLKWLRDQVEMYLRFGKVEQREVAVVEEDINQGDLFGMTAGRRRPGPKASFAATTEYTPKERLHILVVAITHAVPHVLEMADAIPQLLHPRAGETVARVMVIRESETGELEEKTLQPAAAPEKVSRLNNVEPRASTAIITIECKFYAAARRRSSGVGSGTALAV